MFILETEILWLLLQENDSKELLLTQGNVTSSKTLSQDILSLSHPVNINWIFTTYRYYKKKNELQKKNKQGTRDSPWLFEINNNKENINIKPNSRKVL